MDTCVVARQMSGRLKCTLHDQGRTLDSLLDPLIIPRIEHVIYRRLPAVMD
jgi:hypothetical protein